MVGAPGLGDVLGWGDEATRVDQGCGGGPLSLGLLERDINPRKTFEFTTILAEKAVIDVELC